MLTNVFAHPVIGGPPRTSTCLQVGPSFTYQGDDALSSRLVLAALASPLH